jgi:uncharacterized LabA/DUF88 family protein
VSKNVAVFVDVANIFYAAKAAGADIDYVTLLKAAVAGRDFVRAYAYTGLDPENENQRNFHAFLARHGYKVVSKDIRKYGDGKVKANLDIELVVDMMKTARNLDVAIVVSGDGDFAPAIRAVQEMGVRVEVISFRGNTSSDLIDVADAFYDITQLAKVDRDSSRSGRRVADDEEDLSMTEVPDKQTEGRGSRRGRSRRGRGEAAEETAGSRRGGRGRGAQERGAQERGAQDEDTRERRGGQLVALPGERLSKGKQAGQPSDEEPLEASEEQAASAEAAEGADPAGRRRRRRGGRGRGHGRGQESLAEAGEADAGEIEELEPVAPANRPNQFGSVWDSQIGMADRPERLAPIAPDDEDYAEPEIPEYLLAERKRSGRGGRGQGGRGVRSAYASAVERERFGRSGGSRYPEPARTPQAPRGRREDRQERPQRPPQGQQHRGAGQRQGGGGRESTEPWSEVPPEIEELLRAQLSAKMTRPSEPEAAAPAPESEGETAAVAAAALPPAPATRRGGRKKATEAPADGGTAVEAQEVSVAAAAPAPRSRSRRKPAAEVPAEGAADTAAEAEPAPKKRPVRRKTAADKAAEGGAEAPTEAPAEAPVAAE